LPIAGKPIIDFIIEEMIKKITLRARTTPTLPGILSSGCAADKTLKPKLIRLGPIITYWVGVSRLGSPIRENSHTLQIERLADSIIGRGTEVVKGGQTFKAVRLFIGDDARVEL